MGESYAAAGVDIDAGEEAVRRIGPAVRSTFTESVLTDVGGFGAPFALDTSRFTQPVLVSSTDGVGTKLLVAEATGRYDTIGIDLVAMVVDDLVCQGAEPLFLLDYLAVGALDPDVVERVVNGIAEGCRQARCALIGGEMAEHPGSMAPDRIDVAGFAVGVVERDRLITGDQARPGDLLIGLPSPGLRSNGYSLARRVLLEVAGLPLDDLADDLLRPSVIYAPAVVDLLAEVDVRGVAHITGGGIPGNLPRALPDDVGYWLDRATWDVPAIFGLIQEHGQVSDDEMAKVFNLGIGMVVVVTPADAERTIAALGASGHAARAIGEVTKG
ncbi:MAG: phosphoribosylformylglycinamidine cyclo-ligase [Acidimicrobiales bacterium]